MSGTTLRGLIKLNDTLLLGPDPLGNFLSIAVKSIHRKRMPVKEVRGGQTASFALKKVSGCVQATCLPPRGAPPNPSELWCPTCRRRPFPESHALSGSPGLCDLTSASGVGTDGQVGGAGAFLEGSSSPDLQ